MLMGIFKTCDVIIDILKIQISTHWQQSLFQLRSSAMKMRHLFDAFSGAKGASGLF